MRVYACAREKKKIILRGNGVVSRGTEGEKRRIFAVFFIEKNGKSLFMRLVLRLYVRALCTCFLLKKIFFMMQLAS